MSLNFVRYSDQVEHVSDDEADLAQKIMKVMGKGGDIVREREGHALRTSHAKSHAVVKGELKVRDGLPEELRQGLFAKPGSYQAVVRMAHVPGELLDDRKVSTPRGLALKVFGVEGPMLPGRQGQGTQDWVLDTGEVFIASNVKTFLGEITMTEASTPMPQVVKQVVSVMSRANNAALHAVGADSANMDFFGHPKLNPLTETYYSQCPIRYGDYIAKLRARPVSVAQADQPLEITDPNGLRTAVAGAFAGRAVEFAIGVQLCTDLTQMPVEDARAKWSQEESPYREVARLTLPSQDAWSSATPAMEDRLSFCPSHSLAAHRPLGSIMRARMRVYDAMADKRRQLNGTTAAEPRSADELSAA